MGFLDDAGGVLGDFVAVPLGAVGSVAGGATTLALGAFEGKLDASGFGQGFTAGAAFSPAGRIGGDARAEVRRLYARVEPGSAAATLALFGPPATAGEAVGGLALGAAGGMGGRAVSGFLFRGAGATVARSTATRTATRATVAAAPMSGTKKVLAGLGLGALAFEAINPTGNNPLVPDFLERPLEGIGEAAADTAKLVPFLLIGAAAVAAVAFLKPGRPTK